MSRDLWWSFFPLLGISLSDQDLDIDSPMFGDATIVSRSCAGELAALVGHTDEKNRSDVQYLINRAARGSEFHSLVAVRRTGKFEPDGDKEQQLFISARERAYEVASLLSMALISHSKGACGLVEQFQQQSLNTFMIAPGRGFQFSSGGALSFIRLLSSSPRAMTRGELRSILFSPKTRRLSEVLLPQRKLLPHSLAKAVAQSTVRLAEASHSIHPPSQLLGAVTSIEILLSEQGDGFETLRRRLSSLIGDQTLDRLSIDLILRSRHLYVHRGYDKIDGTLSRKALAVALSCLLRYPEVAFYLRDRQAILDYLDLLHRLDKMEVHSANGSLLKTNLGVRHVRKGHRFSFVSIPLP